MSLSENERIEVLTELANNLVWNGGHNRKYVKINTDAMTVVVSSNPFISGLEETLISYYATARGPLFVQYYERTGSDKVECFCTAYLSPAAAVSHAEELFKTIG